jgi:hypothetical protein
LEAFEASFTRKMAHTDNGAMIAAELNRLSLKEREDILHDIHGVAPTLPETTDLITETLKQLYLYLEAHAPSTSAYRMALQDKPSHDATCSSSSSFIFDPSFGLLFLRSEQFNVAAAANKLQRFLQIKLELFGRSKLCQPHITLEDLDDEALRCLENGHFQLLPIRDRAGRAVFCFPGHIQETDTTIQAEVSNLLLFLHSLFLACV